VTHSDSSKSLQELEGVDLGEPTFDSHLVLDCHRLYRVPIAEFTPEDFRLMIGQQIGLPYLVPTALELLAQDPMISGDLYEGDLLETVLRADSRFWIAQPELRTVASQIASAVLSGRPRVNVEESLLQAHDVFLRADYFAVHGRA